MWLLDMFTKLQACRFVQQYETLLHRPPTHYIDARATVVQEQYILGLVDRRVSGPVAILHIQCATTTTINRRWKNKNKICQYNQTVAGSRVTIS